MNNLKAIYFNASNYGIGNTDFQLDATSEEYIKNNVTIYLYSSEDSSEDNSDDGKTWYTPIAWAENHGFNYVNLSEGTTDYVERTLVDEKTGIKVTGKMSKDATMEIIKYAKGSAGLSYLLTGYEKDDILCGYNVLINGNYDGEFEISVPITEEFGNKEPAIQHSENYILKPIKSSIKNNMITFKMNPLDVFLIQLSDKKDEPTNTPTTKPTPTPSAPAGSGTGASSDRVLDDTPKTGANGIMVEMICLTIIGVAGLSFLLKKNKAK